MSQGNVLDHLSLSTQAIRAGQTRSVEGEHSDAIHLTSSFIFNSAAQAAARFGETEPGNIYSRFTNPTVRTYEQRIAAMEQGQFAIASASGMGAITTMVLGLLKQGDHVVVSRNVFGSTINLFRNVFEKLGVAVSFVDLKDDASWKNSITEQTKLFFTETPSNPLQDVVDIKKLADIAHQNDILLVVDNSFLTPVFQQPLKFGADIVIHSATKYVDGQGRCVGGSLVTNDQSVYDKVYKAQRTTGSTMSAFNAWVFLTALETLKIRMEAHQKNALQLANWLEQHPAVTKVYYPGLLSHPDYHLAKTQQVGNAGVVAFDVKGMREGAWKLIDQTSWISITGNLGDTKTTITHPASTTHCRITEKERQQAGISESLIRLSVGLEDPDDIQQDLVNGLNALG